MEEINKKAYDLVANLEKEYAWIPEIKKLQTEIYSLKSKKNNYQEEIEEKILLLKTMEEELWIIEIENKVKEIRIW